MESSQLYLQTLSLAAACSSGSIQRNDSLGLTKIIVNRGIRDADENAGKGVQETLVVNEAKKELQLLSSSSTSAKVAAQSLSPSGVKEVAFSNGKSANGSDIAPSVEIIHHSDGAYGNIKCDLSSVHGAVIGDTWFGGVSWSPDEIFVAYVAKLKAPKKTTAFDTLTVGATTSSTPSTTAVVDNVNKYDFVDDWGEKYVDVNNLGIFILNTATGKVHSLPNIDVSQCTVGQPQFVPACSPSSPYRLAYTSWTTLPRRLGMIYCYHRPCSIYLADISTWLSTEESGAGIDVVHHILSRDIKLARSPRAAPDGRSLIFLGSRRGYLTHGGCSELFRVSIAPTDNLSTVVVETIVAEVDMPALTTSESTGASEVNMYTSRREHISFPGLYLDQLPLRCFVNQTGSSIFCSSLWGSTEEVLLINMETKQIVPLTSFSYELSDALSLSSMQVLDCVYTESGVQLLFSFSAPNAPVRVGLIALDQDCTSVIDIMYGPKARVFSISNKVNLLSASIVGTNFADVGKLLASLSEQLQYQVFLHRDSNGIPFESILITPTIFLGASDAPSSLPIVLVPHGGPHSCFSTAFVAAYVYLALSLKSAVLYVNYRGSTGFGQRSINSLAGTIGTNDVQDMMTCLNHALTLCHPHNPNMPLLKSDKVMVCGGSHGGFLGAHLAAQFPHVFKAAALRNPVTDIAAMVGVSDIPDWCYVESLGVDIVQEGLDQGTINWSNPAPSCAHLTRMREVSPAHVASVCMRGQYRTPTLICLGMKDRRVPPSQGVAFYQTLKLYHGDSVPLALMAFPEDVHAIDLPSTEAEHWIAISKWFQTHVATMN